MASLSDMVEQLRGLNLERAIGLMADSTYAEERALLLEATGKIDEALQAIGEILRDRAGVEAAGWHLRRGELLLAAGRPEEASTSLRAAVTAAGNAELAHRVGHLAGGHGLHTLALELHQTDGYPPKEAFHVFLRRALWRERSGDVDGARREYEAGRFYQKQSRNRSAKIQFEFILKEHPETRWAPKARLGLGEVYMARKRWDDAAGHYRRVLEDYPDSEEAALAREALARIAERGTEGS